MIIETALPSKNLCPFVRKYWRSSSYSQKKISIKLYPKGLVFLVFSFGTKGDAIRYGEMFKKEPKAFISGQITKYGMEFTTQGNARVVGIEITPMALYKLFGIPVNEFNNNLEDLTLIDPKIKELYDKIEEQEDFSQVCNLLDKYLCHGLFSKEVEISPYVENAYQMIIGNINLNVKNIAKNSYISERQLHRGFINQLGVSPKNLMSLQKAHLVLNDIIYNTEYSLDKLSYKWGYFDPSHLTYSFKKFFNSSPSSVDLKEILQLENFHGWKEFSSFIK